MNQRFILIILFFFKYIFLLSQTGSSLKISEVKNISDSLNEVGNFYGADSVYYAAEELYRKEKDWQKWFKSISLLRIRFQKRAEFIKVKSLLDKYEKYVPASNLSLKAKIKFNKGYNFDKLVEYTNSINEYKKSLQLFTSIKEKENIHLLYMYNIYNNLASNYAWIRDLDSALKYCAKGIDFCSENNMDEKIFTMRINKAQFYYYNEQFLKSISEYKEALAFCSESDSSFIYVALAEVYLDLEEFTLAKDHLEIALSLDSSQSYYYLKIQSRFLFETGDILRGKLEKEKAIEIVRKKNDPRTLIKELVSYSISLFNANEKEKGFKYAHQALCYYYPNMDKSNHFSRPILKDVIPYTYIVEALYIKAKYFRESYLNTKEVSSLEESKYYYNLLLSYFDKLKSKHYSSNSKYRLGEYSQKIYSEIITFYIDQYKLNNNPEYVENAFSLAQRANSFVLRNSISDRKALELAGVQQDSLEQYLYLTSKVSSGANEDSVNAANVLMEFDEYKSSLLSNYPTYGKYEKEEEISIKELQSLIDPNQLVVKYYYFNEILTAIGISKSYIFAENIPINEEMNSIINSNLDIISQDITSDSLANSYLMNSKKVYDLVLGDLLTKYDLGDIDLLTIIPDGPLKKVSFNALAIEVSSDWDNPNTYLMSKYAINYLYYSSQLKNDGEEYKSKKGFLGFGIEYEDDFLTEIVADYMASSIASVDDSGGMSLSSLKYADDEVLASAEVLNGTSFVNYEVTPSKVYSTINNYDVVHFSAHAFVDEDDYLNSFVVLHKDEDEKYQLKYSDILNLDVDSELVVLSACQTSSGKSVVGEGLMSLSRAFVQSGSDAAVGAYWNAPDYASKELMTLFYSNLKDGKTKSKAMQQAQIEYLTNDKISSPTIRSPFFWASWAVYGNDEPLQMSSSSLDFISMKSSLLIVGIGLLIWFMFRFFSKK